MAWNPVVWRSIANSWTIPLYNNLFVAPNFYNKKLLAQGPKFPETSETPAGLHPSVGECLGVLSFFISCVFAINLGSSLFVLKSKGHLIQKHDSDTYILSLYKAKERPEISLLRRKTSKKEKKVRKRRRRGRRRFNKKEQDNLFPAKWTGLTSEVLSKV